MRSISRLLAREALLLLKGAKRLNNQLVSFLQSPPERDMLGVFLPKDKANFLFRKVEKIVEMYCSDNWENRRVSFTVELMLWFLSLIVARIFEWLQCHMCLLSFPNPLGPGGGTWADVEEATAGGWQKPRALMFAQICKPSFVIFRVVSIRFILDYLVMNLE